METLKCAVLPAAGRGTRMKHLTEHCPKCLIPINGRPLLDYWLEKCALAGVERVYVNGFYLADQVERFLLEVRKKYSFEICCRREAKLTGTGGFLRSIRKELADFPIFFMGHADNFTDLDLTDFARFHESRKAPLSAGLFHTTVPESCGIVEKMDADGRIVEFREKPEDPKSDLASGAMFMLTPEVLETLPEKESIDFSREILPLFQGRMYGYVLPGFNIDIGTPENYAHAQMLARKERVK